MRTSATCSVGIDRLFMDARDLPFHRNLEGALPLISSNRAKLPRSRGQRSKAPSNTVGSSKWVVIRKSQGILRLPAI